MRLLQPGRIGSCQQRQLTPALGRFSREPNALACDGIGNIHQRRLRTDDRFQHGAEKSIVGAAKHDLVDAGCQ